MKTLLKLSTKKKIKKYRKRNKWNGVPTRNIFIE